MLSCLSKLSVMAMKQFSRHILCYLLQANMLEGGGKTPILSPAELEETGYKLIAYPLSLIGVSMRAMEVS